MYVCVCLCVCMQCMWIEKIEWYIVKCFDKLDWLFWHSVALIINSAYIYHLQQAILVTSTHWLTDRVLVSQLAGLPWKQETCESYTWIVVGQVKWVYGIHTNIIEGSIHYQTCLHNIHVWRCVMIFGQFVMLARSHLPTS